METIAIERERSLAESSELADFCEREYPRLVGTLALYCGNRDLAQELAQESLARACARWARVRRMDAPGAWVHRVGINLANSHYRRRALERRVAAKLDPTPELVELPDSDTGVALRRAVAGLPKRQRAALVLRYFSDLSIHEVADLMGSSEGNVKRLTHEAIASLRKNPALRDLEVRDDT